MEQCMIHSHSNGDSVLKDAGDLSQNSIQGEEEEQHHRRATCR